MIASSRLVWEILKERKNSNPDSQDRQREVGPAACYAEITKAYAKAARSPRGKKRGHDSPFGIHLFLYFRGLQSLIDAQLKAGDIAGAQKMPARILLFSYSYTYYKMSRLK